MRRVAMVGWIMLLVGVAVLGMRSVGLLQPRDAARVEMVSKGATIGDDPSRATSQTAPLVPSVPSDAFARIGIISVALGIFLVVFGNPTPAPSERRLIGT